MKINQFGRSMVEMLGVLAIVGVLSVGAIAGYQKAMFKYKMNKLTSGITYLLNNIDFILSHNDYEINSKLSYFIAKLNLIPEGFRVENPNSNSPTIYHPFNGHMDVSVYLPYSQKTNIGITINNLSYDACAEFFSNISLDLPSLLYLGIYADENNTVDYALYYIDRVNHLGNKNKIAQLCNTYCKEKSNKNYCKIRIEKYLILH